MCRMLSTSIVLFSLLCKPPKENLHVAYECMLFFEYIGKQEQYVKVCCKECKKILPCRDFTKECLFHMLETGGTITGTCGRCMQSYKGLTKLYTCTECGKRLPLSAFNGSMVKNIGSRKLDRLLCEACIPSDDRVCPQCEKTKPKEAFGRRPRGDFHVKCIACLAENDVKREAKGERRCAECYKSHRMDAFDKGADGNHLNTCRTCLRRMNLACESCGAQSGGQIKTLPSDGKWYCAFYF
jgi:hypothetical protein